MREKEPEDEMGKCDRNGGKSAPETRRVVIPSNRSLLAASRCAGVQLGLGAESGRLPSKPSETRQPYPK